MSLGVALGGPNTSDEDPDQLLNLFATRIEVRRCPDFLCSPNKSQPALCLTQFLQANSQLVKEIPAGF